MWPEGDAWLQLGRYIDGESPAMAQALRGDSSETKTFPKLSAAMPRTWPISAAVAAPPSPLYPIMPEPANGRRIPEPSRKHTIA
jgi:hypothetical protein